MLRRLAHRVPSGLVLMFVFTPFWGSLFLSNGYPPSTDTQILARVTVAVSIVACGLGLFQPAIARISFVMLAFYAAICVGRLVC